MSTPNADVNRGEPGPSFNPGQWQLLIHQGDQPDRCLTLHGDLYRIGRDQTLEIALDHGAVSRVHAVLERNGRRWRLKDLQSTNGLWWKGRRVQTLELRDGDRVALAPETDSDALVL